jgi:hypothetical protein
MREMRWMRAINMRRNSNSIHALIVPQVEDCFKRRWHLGLLQPGDLTLDGSLFDGG